MPPTAPRPAEPRARFRDLGDDVRAESLRETLAEHPRSEAVWVFGYGSLMWNPCFSFDERHDVVLEGYERSFCIWTVLSRGSPEKPGLGLGLREKTGRCHGRIFRLSSADQEEGLHALWRREMLTGIYRPTWITAPTRRGALRAVTFVVDEAHPQFAGDFPLHRQAEIIATAVGEAGTCRDYLAGTVAELESSGIPDPELSALLRAVDAFLTAE